MSKEICLFKEGNAEMKNQLGNKGAQLAEMSRIGMPVPPGFVITTEVCAEYSKKGALPHSVTEGVKKALESVEKKTGKKFGDPSNPLFFSVRSGAVFSMPGMIDTVLNLGMNDSVVEGLAKLSGDERFAWDCYRRFIQMFNNIVMGVELEHFEKALEAAKEKAKAKYDSELRADQLKQLVSEYKRISKEKTGKEFPQDPMLQLMAAIEAVFRSWNNKRAVTYRRLNNIPNTLGTAVNVQTMVFGNMGADSGTGVAFTRDPATGENKFYGEYLMTAQGEDVVAGIRTPLKIEELRKAMPQIYKQLTDICATLEKHYRDMQDIEFTIEHGKLWMLQTRNGKRTARAAFKIAHDMVKEGLITKEEALLRVDPSQLDKLLHPSIDPKAKLKEIAKGVPASPGAACGKVYFDPDVAEEKAKKEKVILVRPETTPDDIHGIYAAQGVLTSRGGTTCHAAIVTRGMGKPCIVGCESIKIDMGAKTFSIAGNTVKEGDVISIDGTTGQVILGEAPVMEPDLGSDAGEVLSWADGVRKLGVRANADTPANAKKARSLGAQGIGLCRTERMFNDKDRLPIVQEMILAEGLDARKKALDKLLPMQRGDFEGILEAMDGYPVTIRLLDPPLHEFLPNPDEVLVEVTKLRCDGGKDSKELEEKEKLLKKINELREFNPMLGHRGCRLGITHPEIYEMQVQAIFEAAIALKKKGKNPVLEVMIPLVGHSNELKTLRERLELIARSVMDEKKTKIDYLFGTMIEIPRAALTADMIAKHADFFSFGTNDLTQTTFGYSRDDAEGKFLQHYLHEGVLEANPFEKLDQSGVGRLMALAVKDGRKTRPALKVGICGEVGGDPSSIVYCHKIGLNYVSCSSYRVPIARLAAAQAVLHETKTSKSSTV